MFSDRHLELARSAETAQMSHEYLLATSLIPKEPFALTELARTHKPAVVRSTHTKR